MATGIFQSVLTSLQTLQSHKFIEGNVNQIRKQYCKPESQRIGQIFNTITYYLLYAFQRY